MSKPLMVNINQIDFNYKHILELYYNKKIYFFTNKDDNLITIPDNQNILEIVDLKDLYKLQFRALKTTQLALIFKNNFLTAKDLNDKLEYDLYKKGASDNYYLYKECVKLNKDLSTEDLIYGKFLIHGDKK